MPCVVAEIVAQFILTTIGTIFQCMVLDTDEELVLGIDIGSTARTVREQGSTLLGSPEPEHQGIVLLVVARKEVGLYLHTLLLRSVLWGCILVELQCHTFWQCPCSSLERQVGTLCQVGGIVALALIHRIVVSQSLLITCQEVVGIGIQQGEV